MSFITSPIQDLIFSPIDGPILQFPVLNYRFAGSSSLEASSLYGPNLNFNRSSAAWGWVEDSNGNPVLKKFAADEPRINTIDPATGKELGYLAEESRTNELTTNRDPSGADWFRNALVSLNAVGLDGKSNTAATIEDNDTGDTLSRQQNISINDDTKTHTFSLYVKKDNDTSRFPRLAVRFVQGTTELDHEVQFSTKDGSKHDIDSDGVSSIKDAGDFWRVIVSMTNNGTGNTIAVFRIFPAMASTLTGSADKSVTGSIVYDFGQVELGS